MLAYFIIYHYYLSLSSGYACVRNSERFGGREVCTRGFSETPRNVLFFSLHELRSISMFTSPIWQTVKPL